MATAADKGGRAGGWVAAHRGLLAYGLVGLACLLTLVVSLSVWVNRQLLDTDVWVDQSTKMLRDDQVRHALAIRIVDAAYSQGDVEQRLQDRLPPQLAPLAGTLAGALRPAAIDTAEAILERPAVVKLWEEANRLAHTTLVKVLEGNEGGNVTTTGGEVVLDLTPIVAQVRDALGIENPVLPQDAGRIVIMQSDQLEAAQTAVQVIKVVSVVAAIAIVALFVLAVWLAQGFRRRAVRAAAWGLILVGVILAVVRRLAGNAVVDSLASPDGQPAAKQVWALATSVMRDLAIGLIVLGIVGLIWAFLAGSTRLGVRARGLIAPTLRERPVLAYSVVVLVFLLLLLWGPVGAPRALVGTLFILLAAVAGTEALRRQTLQEPPPSPR